MMDGEHYIRGLSDSELERFAGLNRNMYTKVELKVADDEIERRKRARAEKNAPKIPPEAPRPAPPAPHTAEAPKAGQSPAHADMSGTGEGITEEPKRESRANTNTPPAGLPASPQGSAAAAGEPFMFCIHCGQKLTLTSAYCIRCGKRVSLDDEV